jgi:rhamnogalacturonyl hydrolase YesR
MLRKNICCLIGILTICPLFAEKKYSAAIDEKAVKQVVNDAIAWQKDNMPTNGRDIWNPQYTGWADGVFLSAVADWAHYDNSRDFKAWYQAIAEKNRWEVGNRSLNPANDIAVALMYGRIWLDDPKPYYIVEKVDHWDLRMVMDLFGGWTSLIPTIERLDYQMKYYPKTDNLLFEVPQNQERWCWCDALYMAAPTYALFANITENDEYREFMNREFWATTKALFDPLEKLFFRDTRFISQREANGAKIFWGRGNGWVIGALARMLDYLPEGYPDRPRYVKIFQDMISRIATLQDENGYWHTSLLDYETFSSPETSASGFFTFGLWWGINRNLLDKKTYLPIAKKAWEAMVAAVHENGKLGYVQPIGDTPQNITSDKNEVYGTAAFALAGLEVARFASDNK